MDNNDYLAQLGMVVGMVVNLTIIIAAYLKLSSYRGEKAKELHDKFILVKNLAIDIDKNYCEILIILSGLTKANLSKKEVCWFIEEPRAFLKLEQYGRVSGRYCKIDLKKGEFALGDKVDNFNKRVLESLRVVLFGFLIMTIVTLAWFYFIADNSSPIAIYISFFSICAYFLLIIWGVTLLLTSISNAKKLAGKP